MRLQIINNVNLLEGCYEPSVPNKNTPKPYAVIVQGADTSRQDPTSFQRSVEIWIYERKTTFQNLDELMIDVINALHLKTFTDPNTNQSYTAAFNGSIGQDVFDEEWNAIARGLQFSVIALYGDAEKTSDTWVNAISNFTEKLGITTYRDTWKKDFEVPSVLWRGLSADTQPINMALYRENRSIRGHVVSTGKADINNIITLIETELIKSIKIPLDIKDKRFLTVKSIREDRNADMLGLGQVTIDFTRLQSIDNPGTAITKIYGRGEIE